MKVIKFKLNMINNYIKILFTVIILCDNFLEIVYAKLFNKDIYSLNLRNGIKFMVKGKIGKADLSMLSEIWYYKYYNPKGFEINNNDIVFDIGANNGYFSLYAAKKGKKIYAFEPLPKLCNKIRETIQINKVGNVVLENIGIAEEKGELSFFESHIHNGCHSLFKRDESDTEIKIKINSLENYCNENNIKKIDFLKLDCEGAEYQIFESLSEDFLRKKIVKISLEYHDDIIKSKSHTILVKILEQNNFKVFIENGYLYALNKDFIN